MAIQVEVGSRAGGHRYLCICPKCDCPTFREGRDRSYGEHPEHMYCRACGMDVTWFGAKRIEIPVPGAA